MTAYAIEAVHRDEGTIVLFEGWRVPQRAADAVRAGVDATVYTDDTTTYLIAVDHRMAQTIVDDLEGGEPVIVEAEGWQIVGTIR